MTCRVVSAFLRLMILGPPGSGKGTIGKRLADTFDLKHVSSGDALRDHIARSTAIGIQAKEFIEDGRLVPDDLINDLMLNELVNTSDHHRGGWLLDGYPRTLTQAKLLSERQSLDAVVYLNVPFQTIIDRVKDRWVHAPSGRVYNLLYNPPRRPGVDDITGEQLTQREDDKAETVGKRLENYQQLTTPLLKYYEDSKKLQTFTGTESDKLWPEVEKYIRKLGN